MEKAVRIWGFFLAQYTGAIAQLRFFSPFNYFPRNEFKFVYAPCLKAILKLLSIPRGIIFQRNICPLKVMNRIIKLAHSYSIVTIMDMDDLLIHTPPLHPAHAYYEKIKSSLVEALKSVDFITVTNNHLKNYYQKYNPNVHVLSNFLDGRIWNAGRVNRKRGNKIVIGYAGSPTHVYDFKTVTPAVKYILSKYNDKVYFKFIGCMPLELKNVHGVEHIPELSSYRDYASTLMNSNFDFVIAPLEDNDFNRCKSNIKFLEYSGCGYAGIYSAVGPYIDSIVPDKTGLLIKNETSEWIKAMELLINNSEFRHTLAKNAFQHVNTNCSHEKKSKEWRDFYSRIPASFQEKKNVPFSILAHGRFLAYIQAINIYYKIRNIALFKNYFHA